MKVMSFETVQDIVTQIKFDPELLNSVKKIEVGGAGDCFLNKELIEILRYIKKKLPSINIVMFTNFNGLTMDKSKIILSEELVNELWVNVDSMKPDDYKFIKGLELKKILNNIKDFISIREDLNKKLSLNILILSGEKYKTRTYERMKQIPYNVKEGKRIIHEDEEITRGRLSNIIKEDIDKIIYSNAVLWAERRNVDISKIDYNCFSCPQLKRIYKEMFISPSGESYLCCLDNRFDLTVGNVVFDGIKKVWNSEKRLDLINKLENKKFKEVGYPCNTVNCCKSY